MSLWSSHHSLGGCVTNLGKHGHLPGMEDQMKLVYSGWIMGNEIKTDLFTLET